MLTGLLCEAMMRLRSIEVLIWVGRIKDAVGRSENRYHVSKNSYFRGGGESQCKKPDIEDWRLKVEE